MQISVFEKYIPLHRLQRNNAEKRHGPPIRCHHPTLSTTPHGLKAKVSNPNVCLQFLPSHYCLSPRYHTVCHGNSQLYTSTKKRQVIKWNTADLSLPRYRKPVSSVVTG